MGTALKNTVVIPRLSQNTALRIKGSDESFEVMCYSDCFVKAR